MKSTSKVSLVAMAGALLAAAGSMSVPITGGGTRTLTSSGDAFTMTKAAGGQSDKRGRTSSEFAGGAWLRLRGTRARRAAYGWTNAHQKRVARKARNVARSRRK